MVWGLGFRDISTALNPKPKHQAVNIQKETLNPASIRPKPSTPQRPGAPD